MPVELETLVVGTLGTDSDAGGVRTAAAVRNVVDEVVAEADRVVLFPPEHDGVPPEPGDVWQPRSAVAKQPDPRQAAEAGRRDGGPGPGVLAVAGYMSVQLGELFGDPTPRIVVGSSAAGGREAVRRPPQSGDGSGAPVTDAAVKAVGADVYDDAGDRDNAGRVSRVIDGNPSTGWKTFNYRQQFPALKPGVEHHDPQLLALEAAHLEDQPVGDIVRTADRPARRRPVGEQPAPELEGGNELGRLGLADPGHLGQLELRRPGEPGQAVMAGQRIRGQVHRRPPARPRPPHEPISSAAVSPPAPRIARRSRGRSRTGTSRIARPPSKVGIN